MTIIKFWYWKKHINNPNLYIKCIFDHFITSKMTVQIWDECPFEMNAQTFVPNVMSSFSPFLFFPSLTLGPCVKGKKYQSEFNSSEMHTFHYMHLNMHNSLLLLVSEIYRTLCHSTLDPVSSCILHLTFRLATNSFNVWVNTLLFLAWLELWKDVGYSMVSHCPTPISFISAFIFRLYFLSYKIPIRHTIRMFFFFFFF